MRTSLLNVILSVTSILVAVAIAEVALWSLDFSYPVFLQADTTMGHSHRPNAEGWYRDEGQAFIKINSHGFRDRERSLEKPAHTVRIAVLGDSYAEALQIDLNHTFWTVLEGALNRCKPFGPDRVEVLNFGVSGYSTAQELILLRSGVWAYSPDIVLLAFLSGNDVRDNSAKLADGYPRPYFNAHLELDSSFQQRTIFRIKSSGAWALMVGLSDYSRVAQLFSMVKHRWGQRSRATPARDVEQDIGLHDHVYLTSEVGDWKEAWTITERLIVQINEDVLAKGAKLLLVALSNAIQVHPHVEIRERFARQLGVPDLFYPERRIQALALRHGIPHVVLAPELQKIAEQSNMFLHGFKNTRMGVGHWNADGHRHAGEIIARRFCSG